MKYSVNHRILICRLSNFLDAGTATDLVDILSRASEVACHTESLCVEEVDLTKTHEDGAGCIGRALVHECIVVSRIVV